MTINRQNNGGESRAIKVLMEQVSNLQTDLAQAQSEIDGLDNSKVSKDELAQSVETQTISANSANIGSTTIATDHVSSNDIRSNELHSVNADFEVEHANTGYVEDLTTDALTVNGDETVVNLNAQRVTVEDSLTAPNVITEDANVTNLTATGAVSANSVSTSTVNATEANVETVNVAQELNVNNLNITGNITGLNNVDIVANSIDTPEIEADEISAGSIYTSDVNHLVPSPSLDNNDTYTVQLPVFTGSMFLVWKDNSNNTVWSATVIGDGKNYSIHWSSVGSSLVVTKLYQYNGHAYIKHNANGSLYYSYHTTVKLEDPAVWYNYSALDNIDPDYQHDCTGTSGQISFGDFYAPKFTFPSVIFDEATINSLDVNSLDVNAVSINGNVGNNGQVLGIVNGKSEWMNIPDPIDADNFTVNNIYINDTAKINNYDVTAYVVMTEDDYNNLTSSQRSNSVFYFTKPNGNLYFQGYGYTPNLLPPPVYAVWMNLTRMDNTMTTHYLVLDDVTATNNFMFSTFYGVTNGTGWNNQISIGVNVYGDTLRTNANRLYIYNACNMYNFSMNLTDTFVINQNLITGDKYDPMEYCINMNNMFAYCNNFNQPFNVSDNVISMNYSFSHCDNFNSPVAIGNNVKYMVGAFSDDKVFNSPVVIGKNVELMDSAFSGCSNFNQPVTIPNSVTSMASTFYNCRNFNQLVNIPGNVTSMEFTFSNCKNFNQPITVPNSVSTMRLTFADCDIFNQPVIISNGTNTMLGTFSGCSNFNQPVTIPNSVTVLQTTFSHCYNLNSPVVIGNNVTTMPYAFAQCSNFNQSVTIPERVTNMRQTFQQCDALDSSTVSIHISHNIALGNTRNYIYNCLVNGECGILFNPSRILNDA